MGKHYKPEEMEKLLRRKLEPWQHQYLKRGIRTQFVWDIETTGFNAKRDWIVCYVGVYRDIVTGKCEWVSDHVTKKDIDISVKKHKNFNFDYRVLQSLSDNLMVVDQAVGHFSTKFDMPFFRTRCLVSKQPELIPDYGKLVQGDTWRMAKNSLKQYRNSLDVTAYTVLGESEKNKVDSTMWMDVWFKNHQRWTPSMNYIENHCVRDVRMTLRILKFLERFNVVSRVYV